MMRCVLVGFFLLSALAGRSQTDGLPLQKISSTLFKKLQYLSATDSLTISVSADLRSSFSRTSFRLSEKYGTAGIYQTKLSKKEILLLAEQSDVLFINEQNRPKEELNTGAVDYTLNRINKAHQFFPAIKGDSVFISIKERAFDTTDIDLKGRVFSSGFQASAQTVHASIMATIIAGGGNSSPFALGAAPSAWVSSANFANLFPEPDSFYQQKHITIQNHSYGTIVENFYGNEAVTYDVNTNNNPVLVQVFSAGNSGTETAGTGVYTNVPAMANLTGNFKQSKNSISVAALDSSGAPMTAASKGPAYDGRLKPELAAYGEDGSSGAAALVSGSAALIQDAYKKRTGQLPSSDVVKAVLLNSAEDVGPFGIDYFTGYGSLNAAKAIEAIQQGRFYQSSVIQNEVKTFSLTIPSNISQLKVTIAWNDKAAQPGAVKALVNDVDLVVKNTTTAETWLPWVLNLAPNKDSLLQMAQRKRDTLNNVEQVTIDAPAAGSYAIEIRGSKITSATQAFAVSFSMDTTNVFTWDYPTADALLAGTRQTLRWRSTFSGTGALQYSFNGTNWLPIAVINLAAGQFKWVVPDTTS
ncbi:MAG: S8 family serine peptidase, partial [Bacteroidota bacterium]|nr:S8 family serine peptidase [Bacteroidota bacterium]